MPQHLENVKDGASLNDKVHFQEVIEETEKQTTTEMSLTDPL